MAFTYRQEPVDTPKLKPPKPKNRIASLINLLFGIELLVLFILKITYSTVNDMGEGGLIFLLPLFAGYIYLLTVVFMLPVLSLMLLKSHTAKTKASMVIALFAFFTNLAFGVWLAVGIGSILVKY